MGSVNVFLLDIIPHSATVVAHQRENICKERKIKLCQRKYLQRMAIHAETICMMLQIFAISYNYGNILPLQLNVINNNVYSDGIYILIQIVDDAEEEALFMHTEKQFYVVIM